MMAAVTSPASCRAAAGRPARALGQLELQLCLAGDTAHPRVGWWGVGMGVSFHLWSVFQGCCWVNFPLPPLRHGEISVCGGRPGILEFPEVK